MADDNDHSASVHVWMERTTSGQPLERQIHAFEQGFAALWRRAHPTLGAVTLAAILDRVLYDAARQHPILSSLEIAIEADGLRCKRPRGDSVSLDDEQLTRGIRFVLVEFLTVLGNLTADILTPSLHAELARAAVESREPDEESEPRTRESKPGEGTES